MQVWVFIQQFRHMRAAGYSKFSHNGWQTCSIHYLLSGVEGTFLSKYYVLSETELTKETTAFLKASRLYLF